MKGCGMKKMAKGGQAMCSPRKQMAMGIKSDGAKAPKKMMGGGMAKGYKYGGMAKKGKKAC